MGPNPLTATAVSSLRGLHQVAGPHRIHDQELGRRATRSSDRLAFELGNNIRHPSSSISADSLHRVSPVRSYFHGPEQPTLFRLSERCERDALGRSAPSFE